MDLLLLAIRTSRPIFVRGGGEGGRGGGVPSQFSVIAARSTGDFYYLRLRALFKSEASL